MSEPFRPTHLLTVQWPDRVQTVALRIESSDGYGFAYTAEEWARVHRRGVGKGRLRSLGAIG